MVWWQKRTKPILLQETIYSPDQEPLLYQEMLRYKASQASHGERFHESDDSDFEIIGQGYYGERESLCIEDDNSSSSSSSSRVSAAGATQVTVELHPPSASSNGDTQTFLSLQPSHPLYMSTKGLLLQNCLEKTHHRHATLLSFMYTSPHQDG